LIDRKDLKVSGLDIPQVSVIMSAYNAESFLTQCIESILNQTYSDFEFIVVNDGSTDGTLEILQSFSDPRLNVIDQLNKGLTATLNELISRSRGKYIARQDADDYSLPERLAKQVQFLENRQDIALIGTGSVQVDHSNSQIHRFIPETRPITLSQQLVEVNSFTHGSWLVRADILKDLNGYREEFRFSQDYDLLLRMNEKYQLSNLAEVLYAHRHSRDMVSIVNVEAQGLFAELARQCWRERADFGSDCIQNGQYDPPANRIRKDRVDGLIRYHKHLISAWTRKGDAVKTRKEIIELLKISPREPFAIIQYALSLGGGGFLKKVTETWEGLRKE
jgi:glycosyltransferase involved in cell wall biosynthesis